MTRRKSRQCALTAFEEDSGDDYDELGSLVQENQEDVVYQGMDRFGLFVSLNFLLDPEIMVSMNFLLVCHSTVTQVNLGTSPSATVTSGSLSDPGMFDPLAEEAEEGTPFQMNSVNF